MLANQSPPQRATRPRGKDLSPLFSEQYVPETMPQFMSPFGLTVLFTLALFAYVATVFVIDIPWSQVLRHTFMPDLSWRADYFMMLVAVFGTTISPYLFFWQASQEVEEQRAAPGEEPLREAPEQAKAHLRRIKIDTYVGMTFSNVVAYFIILTTAVTLHAHGITDIETSAQAAEALRPIAGEFAFLLFAAGIVGTGMLAVPVLGGSAAYAVAESV